MPDLFSTAGHTEAPKDKIMAPGAMLLRGFALPFVEDILRALGVIAAQAPLYANIAGRRVSTAPPAAAIPWSETALMRAKFTGSGIGARDARDASTTSPARCWPGITSRCGSGCCACTSWA